ncbi:hypothetical protein NDU88_000491, partial [Pleurodeles waltl]
VQKQWCTSSTSCMQWCTSSTSCTQCKGSAICRRCVETVVHQQHFLHAVWGKHYLPQVCRNS